MLEEKGESKRSITLNIPFPPSSNRYWRNFNGRMIISKDARVYKAEIRKIFIQLKCKKLENRLSVTITAYPPDKRRRDLDNLLKVSLDSLQYAGFFVDDSQIDELYIERGQPIAPGYLNITIEEC